VINYLQNIFGSPHIGNGPVDQYSRSLHTML